MAETAWFTYDDFADRVGEQFTVALPDGGRLGLRLAAAALGAEGGAEGPDGAIRQQFSLQFRGPGTPRLGQGIWQLDHESMGELALFLVPLEPDADGPRYEAAFA